MATHLELGDFASAKDNGLRKAMLGIGNDYFEKASKEGSRGGKVIGHTKSGKPIYDSFHHKHHESFSAKDHRDAFSAHVRTMESNDEPKKASVKSANTVMDHFRHMEDHAKAADKLDKEKDKKKK